MACAPANEGLFGEVKLRHACYSSLVCGAPQPFRSWSVCGEIFVFYGSPGPGKEGGGRDYPLQIRVFSMIFRAAMNSRSILAGVFIAAISLSVTSCFSSSEVKSQNPTSVGQQLTDLDRAYHQGIITEKEYMRLKKAIISNND